MSDNDLWNRINELGISGSLPLSASVDKVINASNHLYSLSSGLLLQPSPDLLNLRRDICQSLARQSFAIEQGELGAYLPHLTIRLGVALKDTLLSQTVGMFPVSSQIVFSNWALFRVINQNGKRMMRQISTANG